MVKIYFLRGENKFLWLFLFVGCGGKTFYLFCFQVRE